LSTPTSHELQGMDDLDPDLQLAQRMVCIQCRFTTRAQRVSGLIAPSQAIRLAAEELRALGYYVWTGPTSLSPSMTARVHRAMDALDNLTCGAIEFHKDELADAALEAQHLEEEQLAIVSAAQSAATAAVIAQIRQLAGERRASGRTDAVRYDNTFVSCGNQVYEEDLNNQEYAKYRNYDCDKDKDYIPEEQNS
jgi:hypothetical protein